MFQKQKRIVNRKLLNSYHDKPCLICFVSRGTCGHHIKTKGSGGHDIEQNLMPLCQRHHDEIHNIELVAFSLKYKDAWKFLIRNGWEFNQANLGQQAYWYHPLSTQKES